MGFTETTFLFILLPAFILSILAFDRFANRRVNLVVLLFSLFFYAWGSFYTLNIIFCLIFFIYIAGHLIYAANESSDNYVNNAKKWLILSVSILVAALFFYKYLPSIVTKLALNSFSYTFDNLIIPLGISFVIFESISYLSDIYTGAAKPGTFQQTALFILFFPKLIAGPIVQWRDYYPQINNRFVSPERMLTGISRIMLGYSKKAIIADVFGVTIVSIQDGLHSGGADMQTMWLLSLLYFFEIYYDFSGYSDIAIGLSELVGYSFKENFNYPYLSQSVSEFWRRWHISLGSWFREYVYIPMGGSRRGNVYINLFVVFLLTGIWHGANKTFVIWGVLNGLCVVFERFIRNFEWYKRIPSIIKWAFTTVFFFFGWILFMSDSILDFWTIILVMFSFPATGIFNFTWRYYLTNRIAFLLVIAAAGAFGVFRWLDNQLKKTIRTSWYKPFKIIALLLVFFTALMFIVNSSYSPFIYFQF